MSSFSPMPRKSRPASPRCWQNTPIACLRRDHRGSIHVVLPAMERYGCSYLLSTTSEFDYFNGVDKDFFDNYVNLIVPSSAVNSMTLDGQIISAASFTPITASDYLGAHVRSARAPI